MRLEAEWRRILDDPRPSKVLSALGDEVDWQMAANPKAYSIMAGRRLKQPRRMRFPEGGPH